VFYFDNDNNYFILCRIVCMILLCVDVDLVVQVEVDDEIFSIIVY